jgi:hypothetical protein
MDLVEVATLLSPSLDLKLGYQDCPFCKRTKKFKVSPHSFRCYHPECNKKGGALDFIMFNKSCDLPTAIKFIKDAEGSKTDFAGWLERSRFLEQIFCGYENAVNDQTLDFLNGRGYITALEDSNIRIGHAIGDTPLQDIGFPLENLIKYGLAYPDGKEFFRDRVIFPIRDFKGRMVHLQGRTTLSDIDLRWLSTSSKNEAITVAPINQYLYEGDYYSNRESIEWLFLCEGISDGLSLIELNVPAVACFGVDINLLRFDKLFNKVKNLVVLLDNDVYPLLSVNAGLPKSWTAMLPYLVELQQATPQLNIWCCPPPVQPGIKDVNNWLQSGLTANQFARYVMDHKACLFDFTLKIYAKDLRFHKFMLQLLTMPKFAPKIEQFRKLVDLQPDLIQYIIALHEQF